MALRRNCGLGWRRSFGSSQAEEALSGNTVLPPPGHAFWRASPDDVAEQTHRTIANLEQDFRDALTKVQTLSEARAETPCREYMRLSARNSAPIRHNWCLSRENYPAGERGTQQSHGMVAAEQQDSEGATRGTSGESGSLHGLGAFNGRLPRLAWSASALAPQLTQ